jgi:hypothetical protein
MGRSDFIESRSELFNPREENQTLLVEVAQLKCQRDEARGELEEHPLKPAHCRLKLECD